MRSIRPLVDKTAVSIDREGKNYNALLTFFFFDKIIDVHNTFNYINDFKKYRVCIVETKGFLKNHHSTKYSENRPRNNALHFCCMFT